MNELEFKRHLKDLVRGHHHPEQHGWEPRPETGNVLGNLLKRNEISGSDSGAGLYKLVPLFCSPAPKTRNCALH